MAHTSSLFPPTIWEGPLPTSDTMPPDPWAYTSYTNYSLHMVNGRKPAGNGIVLALSETRLAKITDGTSQTILFGEKHVPSGDYEASNDGNDQGWDLGFDIDINRWTKYRSQPNSTYNIRNVRQVIGTIDDDQWSAFGGSHAAGCQFVFCDGSVHTISYDVDGAAFTRLGSFADGEVIDPSAF